MSFLTNVVKVLEALGIKNKSFNDKRYVNTTGDTMTGGLINLTSIDPLTTKAESWIGPSSTTGVYFKGGNVGIGTASPAVKLQVNSIASYESATLGSERLSADNWTLGTGWSGDFATGFAHTSGTADLSNTLAGVIGNYYQITYTVTGRTAGSFTITFGGESYGGRTSTGTFGPRATTTGNLIITPTTDFNGTIVISIKQITANYGATFALNDSTGATSFEIRNSLASLGNTFIGVNSGRRNTTGTNNSSLGNNSLLNNTTGSSNSAQGFQALRSNTTGSSNSAQGVNALYSNTTGSSNSAQGVNALYSNTTGSSNSAQGFQALSSNTTGSSNSAQGVNALRSNTTGSSNSAQGAYTLSSNKTGSNGVAIGVESQRYANDTTTPWTNYNTSVGYQALRGSPTAANNTGNFNNSFGYHSLHQNTSGSFNTAIGFQTLSNNTSGGGNIALGQQSLLSNISGSYNTAFGDSSLYNNNASNNTALGFYALYSNTTGENNIAIGSNAGRYLTDGTGNTSPDYSFYFGANTKSGNTNGDAQNEIVIGYNAIGLGSNTIKLGNTSITNVASNGDFEALDIGDGFILKSPDGTRYRITVADGGALSAVAV